MNMILSPLGINNPSWVEMPLSQSIQDHYDWVVSFIFTKIPHVNGL